MNSKNVLATSVVRTVLALFLLFAGISGLYFLLTDSMPTQDMSEKQTLAGKGLEVSGILLLVKILEIGIGLMLLLNFRPALAALLLAPLSLGIFWYVLVTFSPAFGTAIPALIMGLANVYLGFIYWDKYAPIFHK